ncbi:Variant Ionotropic Glutamate Receptor [Penaeus vannamei]|uniref:Variant Ionotropic Glutamate Receptor n=1 Tax=Penaeus vannamei TaxID=6689 RepID=A0A3R7N6J8_PENVA|nr:Variant Ionotropic Glutamate Receptor [Penaeus vannamei]
MSFASADLLDGCCERRPVGVRSREGKASSSLVIREDGSCRSATEMAAEDRKCLVVGVEIMLPQVMVSGPDDDLQVTGYLVDVLKIILAHLGYCYRFVRSPDRIYGTRQPNGTWNGLIGLVQRGEVNMTGYGSWTTEESFQDFSMSEPLAQSSLTVIYRRPGLQPDMAGFVKPFDPLVWLLLLVSLLVVLGATIPVISYYDRLAPRKGADEEQASKDLQLVVKDSVDWTVNVLLCQFGGQGGGCFGLVKSAEYPGADLHRDGSALAERRGLRSSRCVTRLSSPAVSLYPRGDSVRVVICLWLLTTLILATVYRANLKAMLILPKLTLPFDSLESLVDTDIAVLAGTGSLFKEAMENSPEGHPFRRLKKNMIMDKKQRTNITAAMPRFVKGEVATVVPRTVANFLMHSFFLQTYILFIMITPLMHLPLPTPPRRLPSEQEGRCVMYAIPDITSSFPMSFIFAKGSPLKEQIDPVIRRLRQSGIIGYLYQRQLMNASECSGPVELLSRGELRPLALGDFYGVFMLYAGGIALATLAFGLECLLGRLCPGVS